MYTLPNHFNLNIIFTQRLWQGLAGLLTLFFLTHYLSSELQGWYYSFLSFAALYTMFDLGLSTALVQISAHYFVYNQWSDKGEVIGEKRNHFHGLLGQSSRLYLIISILFFLFLIPSGLFFFSQKPPQNIVFTWKWPWIFLILATSLNILMLPFLSLVEGSGRIQEVYRLRLVQGLIGPITCWIVLMLGGGLWSLVAVPAVSFVATCSWLTIKMPKLFSHAWTRKKSGLHWGTEIWPLQWRIGISWMSGYFLMQIYTPILFYYQSANVAGQMGLSLAIANMLGLLAQSWIALRVPTMAMAVGHKDWALLDHTFKYSFIVSIVAYLFSAILMCSVNYYVLSYSDYGDRTLPLLPFIGLLLIVFINHINGALAAQLRSYKKEPLVWISFSSAILTVPLALLLVPRHSVEGVIAAVLLVQIMLTLPLSVYLWFKYNNKWRA